ncbi:MAG: alpha/beta hydrolase [Phenylobacterium sp.]|nr:alpha/beta hydrolase [Phenylobacterium sp.]
MQPPRPSHLDTHDPAKAGVRDIREEADREIDAYGGRTEDLVMLLPEDRWAEFLQLTGGEDRGGETRYRGVNFRKAAVTAVIAQDGF